ncbi:glutathionylspermidine synthase family protein [Flexibacterium corallicola]|uniref:glutathionylspermidine synthase family protein n=1 Tax=Flexibacterium corallicola TaxID=3037259 RepID=UPI00286F9BDD|nr:glutathionylspermidine synthase family protein [Pseudovibrio sp. M1P-2-3]
MKRIQLPERKNWRQQAKELGFIFHSMNQEPYWDETRAYVFTMDQVESDLEDVTQELYGCCLQLVDRVVESEELLSKLMIPQAYWDWIRNSWKSGDPSLYGRFDFLYDGSGPAKLLEFNADTPTSLYETGFFQWMWLEDMRAAGDLPANSDQFNSVQDKLIARFSQIFEKGCHLHFSCCKDTIEDRATLQYLEDCARQAGLLTHFVYLEDVGADDQYRFADLDNTVIDNWFKLYPLEDMFRESYGPLLPKTPTQIFEPAWKAILSNKGILPLLWQMYEGHPNLLPSSFENKDGGVDLTNAYVRKPLFSREGANVEIFRNGALSESEKGPYGQEGYILQQFKEVPKFGQDHTVIGSWIIGEEAAGIGIREDHSLITRDTSRFVPHLILD